MISPHQALRERAYRRIDQLSRHSVLSMPPIEELRKTEGSPKFRKLCQNRLIMGAFRYGRFGISGKKKWARIDRAIYELQQYKKDGNDERLVDVANMCELEFVEGIHPNKHFASVDDGVHTQEVV